MAQLLEFEKISCYSTSKGEASFIYKEIFEDGCYDISNLPEAPLVIDAGANIGLFSLYVKSKFPLSKIIAFEPAPETYEILRRNLELHNISGVEALPFGLASKAGTEKLTYFPKLPGNSTIKPEEKKKLFELAVQVDEQAAANLRFEDSQQVDVQLERLSNILNTYPSFARIDFLKIDVEGAELEVLRGLDDNHWGLVRNIILETWDGSGDRDEIEGLLKSKGFIVKREEATWGKEFWMVSASRES
ncbi:FkbM family methyltransferase [Xylaria telfairii]|nr:FkbM family methyltransferase [Xylaria telfairii]